MGRFFGQQETLCPDYDYSRVPVEEANQLCLEMVNYYTDYQIVVLGTFAGLGHCRMSEEITAFWKNLGFDPLNLTFNFSHLANNGVEGFGAKGLKIYEYFQRNSAFGPAMQTLYDSFPTWIVDLMQNSWLNTQNFIDFLNQAGVVLDEKTLFLSTHPLPTTNLISYMTQDPTFFHPDSCFGEYVTDPGWLENSILGMSCPIGIGSDKHFACFHDSASADRFSQANLRNHRLVLPWGTPSPYQYLTEGDSTPVWEEGKPLVMSIEWSGTQFDCFDLKIEAFIRANLAEIKSGALQIIMHTVNHISSHSRMHSLLEELNLSNSRYIKLIRNKSSKESAAYERDKILLGQENFPIPHCSIVKSGEQGIQDNGKHTRVVVFCALPHENRNAKCGVSENRVILADRVCPGDLLNLIKTKLPVTQRKITPSSLALLAPLALKNPGHINNLRHYTI